MGEWVISRLTGWGEGGIFIAMFLQLNHQKLDTYIVIRELVRECYKLAALIPEIEKFGLQTQIRRAAISVQLNMAEGASRSTIPERKRFYEIARGSVIEIDAALDIANDLGYLTGIPLPKLETVLLSSFKLLTALMKN